MKCFLAIIVACSVIVQAENIQQQSVVNVRGGLIAEPLIPTADGIKKFIEAKRDELVDKGYNDIHLNDFVFPIDNDALGTRGQIKASGVISGLVGFEVIKLSGILSYNFDVVWPEIDIQIEPYDLQGYINLIQVFGTGTLRANIKELGIFGKVGLFPDIGNPPTSIHIESVKLNVKLTKEQDEKWNQS